MTAYTYHCVAGPRNIRVKTDNDRASAVKAFEDIINEQAAEGWEYVGIDEYSTTVYPGCFSFQRGPQITILKMLIFRRPAED